MRASRHTRARIGSAAISAIRIIVSGTGACVVVMCWEGWYIKVFCPESLFWSVDGSCAES